VITIAQHKNCAGSRTQMHLREGGKYSIHSHYHKCTKLMYCLYFYMLFHHMISLLSSLKTPHRIQLVYVCWCSHTRLLFLWRGRIFQSYKYKLICVHVLVCYRDEFFIFSDLCAAFICVCSLFSAFQEDSWKIRIFLKIILRVFFLWEWKIKRRKDTFFILYSLKWKCKTLLTFKALHYQ
jgi:hypothetical protein